MIPATYSLEAGGGMASTQTAPELVPTEEKRPVVSLAISRHRAVNRALSHSLWSPRHVWPWASSDEGWTRGLEAVGRKQSAEAAHLNCRLDSDRWNRVVQKGQSSCKPNVYNIYNKLY